MLPHLSLATASEFSAEFMRFTNEAFRLECLQVFDDPDERAGFAGFLANKNTEPQSAPMDGWRKINSAAKGRGATMKRLRIVIPPLSDYLQFEIAWGYSFSVRFGEQISFLEVGSFADVQVEHDLLKDFWLFDESRGYIIDYDLRGRFLGAWRTDAALTKMLVKDKTSLWPQGTPIQENALAAQWLRNV
jgi:hypothetical protein